MVFLWDGEDVIRLKPYKQLMQWFNDPSSGAATPTKRHDGGKNEVFHSGFCPVTMALSCASFEPRVVWSVDPAFYDGLSADGGQETLSVYLHGFVLKE